jgi:hypothetical protein
MEGGGEDGDFVYWVVSVWRDEKVMEMETVRLV